MTFKTGLYLDYCGNSLEEALSCLDMTTLLWFQQLVDTKRSRLLDVVKTYRCLHTFGRVV